MQLKPCPFCGENEQEVSELTDGVTKTIQNYEVRCGYCDARSGKCGKPKAAQLEWNKRVNEQDLADLKKDYENTSEILHIRVHELVELAEKHNTLKQLVGEIDELWGQKEYYTRQYNQGEIQMSYFGKIGAIDLEIRKKLKQACTLADDSKEE